MQLYDKNYFNLTLELARTQFKMKDQSSFFGLVWSFLNPILMLTILFVIFQFRMGQDIDNYAVYLLVGVVQYTHFSNTTGSALSIISTMKNLSSNAIFPKEIMVIGSVLADVFEFVVSILFCLIMCWAMGIQLTWALLFLPVIILLQILFTLWVSLLLSVIYVFVRDVRHIYQVILRMLFFVTPIFYDISMIGDGLGKILVLLNPLTHLVQFGRTIIIDGSLPPFALIAIVFTINLFLVHLALVLFRKSEPRFAEYL